MRGEDRQSGELFAYVGIEVRLSLDHPLRTIKVLVDEALKGLSGDFQSIYADGLGRPLIPPEQLDGSINLAEALAERSACGRRDLGSGGFGGEAGAVRC